MHCDSVTSAFSTTAAASAYIAVKIMTKSSQAKLYKSNF